MLKRLFQKWTKDRALNNAKKLILSEGDELTVSPENLLILWKGFTALQLSSVDLVHRMSAKCAFNYRCEEVLHRLQEANDLLDSQILPSKTASAPEQETLTLRRWLSTTMDVNVQADAYLLALGKAVEANVDKMYISRDFDDKGLYEIRLQELFYVYCDVMNFCDSILRRTVIKNNL